MLIRGIAVQARDSGSTLCPKSANCVCVCSAEFCSPDDRQERCQVTHGGPGCPSRPLPCSRPSGAGCSLTWLVFTVRATHAGDRWRGGGSMPAHSAGTTAGSAIRKPYASFQAATTRKHVGPDLSPSRIPLQTAISMQETPLRACSEGRFSEPPGFLNRRSCVRIAPGAFAVFPAG